MTEHTRIPLPGERSLLERAAPRFEFAAPPVPRLPAAPIAPPPRVAAATPLVAAPIAPPAPQPFSGKRHPIDRARLG